MQSRGGLPPNIRSSVSKRLRVILREGGACDDRVEVLRRRAKRVEQNRDVVNGAGSRNDFCWLTKVNVTFPMESQPHSIRDPFLARPSVVLVGFCSARKLPHKNFDSVGTARLPSLRMTHRIFVRCEQKNGRAMRAPTGFVRISIVGATSGRPHVCTA